MQDPNSGFMSYWKSYLPFSGNKRDKSSPLFSGTLLKNPVDDKTPLLASETQSNTTSINHDQDQGIQQLLTIATEVKDELKKSTSKKDRELGKKIEKALELVMKALILGGTEMKEHMGIMYWFYSTWAVLKSARGGKSHYVFWMMGGVAVVTLLMLILLKTGRISQKRYDMFKLMMEIISDISMFAGYAQTFIPDDDEFYVTLVSVLQGVGIVLCTPIRILEEYGYLELSEEYPVWFRGVFYTTKHLIANFWRFSRGASTIWLFPWFDLNVTWAKLNNQSLIQISDKLAWYLQLYGGLFYAGVNFESPQFLRDKVNQYIASMSPSQLKDRFQAFLKYFTPFITIYLKSAVNASFDTFAIYIFTVALYFDAYLDKAGPNGNITDVNQLTAILVGLGIAPLDFYKYYKEYREYYKSMEKQEPKETKPKTDVEAQSTNHNENENGKENENGSPKPDKTSNLPSHIKVVIDDFKKRTSVKTDGKVVTDTNTKVEDSVEKQQEVQKTKPKDDVEAQHSKDDEEWLWDGEVLKPDVIAKVTSETNNNTNIGAPNLIDFQELNEKDFPEITPENNNDPKVEIPSEIMKDQEEIDSVPPSSVEQNAPTAVDEVKVSDERAIVVYKPIVNNNSVQSFSDVYKNTRINKNKEIAKEARQFNEERKTILKDNVCAFFNNRQIPKFITESNTAITQPILITNNI